MSRLPDLERRTSTILPGFYECQITSVEPKLSRSIELRMVEARSDLGNLSEIFVRPGDPIRLVCSIEAPEPTDFVYWYKNESPVQFDNLKSRQTGQPDASGLEAPGGFVSGISRDWPSSADESEVLREAEGRERRAGENDEPAWRINELQDELEQRSERPKHARRKNWSPVRSSSSLTVGLASANDTGNYTCLVSSRARRAPD